MNIVTIQKPAPHCPIPYGHPLHSGYVPADETRIWRTWSRAADVARTFAEHSKLDLMDDYEKTDALDFLSNGSFKS